MGIIPGSDGGIEAAIYIYEPTDLLEFGVLPRQLPPGSYQLEEKIPHAGNLALGWALEAYILPVPEFFKKTIFAQRYQWAKKKSPILKVESQSHSPKSPPKLGL